MAKEPIKQELLAAADVAMLMGMGRTAFQDYLKATPEFPKPIVVGKTKGGQKVRRWRRRTVEAFIELREPEDD